ISVEKDNRYEESFIPIAKIGRGYTGDDLEKINDRIQDLKADRYGPTLGIKPGIIIRTAFSSIEINNRTKAGYTLRSPRFKAVLRDTHAAHVNSVKDVEELYYQKLTEDRSPQKENPSFTLKKGSPKTPDEI